MNIGEYVQTIWFGLVMTILAYIFARWLQRRISWLHPILSSAGVLMAILLIGGIPLQSYKDGADLLSIILGPATVALGVPIYKQRELIKQKFKSIILSITCGSIVGIASVAGIMTLLSSDTDMMKSMLSKSVSSPIAVEIAKSIGAIPELAAVFTVITGLVGAIGGIAFLRKTGIVDDVSIGIAMGTSAHGFGTARALSQSERQGSFSGLAMGLMGVITSILFAFIVLFIH